MKGLLGNSTAMRLETQIDAPSIWPTLLLTQCAKQQTADAAVRAADQNTKGKKKVAAVLVVHDTLLLSFKNATEDNEEN